MMWKWFTFSTFYTLKTDTLDRSEESSQDYSVSTPKLVPSQAGPRCRGFPIAMEASHGSVYVCAPTATSACSHRVSIVVEGVLY